MGVEKPFFDRTAIEFTECADLELFSKSFAGGKFEVAPNIISIICRPKQEKYNAAVCLLRADGFSELTMDTVWEVFFCFQKHINLSEQITAISLIEKAIKVRQANQAELKNSVGMEAL